MFFDFIMLLVYGTTKHFVCDFIDRMLVRPTRMSSIQHRGASRIGARPRGTVGGEHGDALDIIEEDLISLTVPVPYTRDEDILMWMRRHTRGGEGCFTRLLRKVAWVVLCYLEHHHDDYSSYV